MYSKQMVSFVREGVYANTAMYGLPPRSALQAGAAAVSDWAAGRVPFAAWEPDVERARLSLARLHGAAPEDVALGGTVSSLVAAVANGVPLGGTVAVAGDEFLSVTLPFEARAAKHEIAVHRSERAQLVETVHRMRPIWVAVSLVRPQDGHLLDAAELIAAARAVGTRVLLDVSQAGWMPLQALHPDVLVGAGHKWLMGPYGTAFMIASPSARAILTPIAAGWTSREDLTLPPWGPQQRARDARGFDQSPAFLAWVVQAAALQVVEEISVERIAKHDLALAGLLAAELSLPAPRSPILSLPEREGQVERLAAAGVRFTARERRIRLSLHLHNTEEDVQVIAHALKKSRTR